MLLFCNIKLCMTFIFLLSSQIIKDKYNMLHYSENIILIMTYSLCHRIIESTGEKKSTSYLMQTIGMAIQRGNSCCILETVLDSRKLDEVYYL